MRRSSLGCCYHFNPPHADNQGTTVNTLEEKSVIITGAGAGLGRAYAEHAASEGARLVLNDISEDATSILSEEFAALHDRVIVTTGDVSDWNYASSLVSTCLDYYGRIDGLVNNAGTYYHARPWDDDADRLRSLYQSNVMGTLYCGVHAMRVMVRQRSGSIVNVTSGAHVGITGLAAYGGTKGAIASLTYGWALELREFGVRANAASPRARTRAAGPGAPADTRIGPQWTAEHAAPLVSFLLSDLAAGITGQVIRLSGDQLSVMAHPWETSTTVTSEIWDTAHIAEAFQTALSGALRPVGLGATSYVG
jgi:NAD(P)-dependent dehydrogenase (short-subunit alcohol dehydrogenase family)